MKNILECDGSGDTISNAPANNYATPANTIGMGNPSDTSGDMISLANYIKSKNNVKKHKKIRKY